MKMHFRRRLPFVTSCTKPTGARPLMNLEHQHISILWILGIQLTISQSALLVPKSLPYRLSSSSNKNNKRPSFSSCLIPNTFPHVGLVRQKGRYLSSSCKYQRFRSILELSNKSLLQPFHDNKDSEDNTPSAASSSLSILTKQILSILATQNPTKTRQRLEPIVEFVTLYSSPNTYNHNTHSVDLPNACSIIDTFIVCWFGKYSLRQYSLLNNHKEYSSSKLNELVQGRWTREDQRKMTARIRKKQSPFPRMRNVCKRAALILNSTLLLLFSFQKINRFLIQYED